jgi:AraC-like DNA-binding protein
VVILCDSYHEYRTRPGCRWEFSWLHFSGVGLEGYRASLLSRLTPVALRAPDAARELATSVFDLSERPDVLALAEASNGISALLTEIMRSLAVGSAQAPLGRGDVRRLADYIRQNCARDLSMEDFISVARLSRYHLIRLFSMQVGMPPYRYLHMCRINNAQHLLRATDRPVSAIAFEVGYADTVNFIRHFRAATGTTPGKYRDDSIRLLAENSSAADGRG